MSAAAARVDGVAKDSIKTGMAVRAFLRVVPDVIAAIKGNRRDPADANAIRGEGSIIIALVEM